MSTDVKVPAEELLARLEVEMRRPPFHAVLGPQAHSVDPESGEVVVCLPFKPEFSGNPEGTAYHGGVIASLIDLAGHAAVAVRMQRPTPTIDLRIDYLRFAPAVTLMAHATVLKAGRAIGRADIQVFAQGVLIAVGRGSFSTAGA